MFYSSENSPPIEDEECGYVYFVRAEGLYPNNDRSWGRFKIGITRNLVRRMRELNGKQQATANTLVFAIAVKKYREIENLLHQKYEEYKCTDNHHSKEWFNLPRVWEESIENLYYSLEQKYYYFQEDAPQTQENYSRVYSSASYSGGDGFGFLLALGLIVIAPIAFFSQKVPEGMQYFETPRTVSIDASASGYGGVYFCRQPEMMPDCNPIEMPGKSDGGVIPNGSVVKELGWNGSWSRVEFEGRQGWVSSKALPD